MVAPSSTLLTFMRPQSGALKPAAPLERIPTDDSSRRFSGALASALHAQAVAQAGATGAASPPGAASAVSPADASARARRTLDLGGAAATDLPAKGDAVLGGLQRLRGVFNAAETRLSAATDGHDISTNGLFKAQMEVARFSLLMDVSSKLAGKSTQAFDTLLKGQ